ncbi:MAG: hypothetical protein P4M04_16720 [Acidobacteriota bacterium]|nr:hypothetical protein [Acidobacteriota bacterium]
MQFSVGPDGCLGHPAISILLLSSLQAIEKGLRICQRYRHPHELRVELVVEIIPMVALKSVRMDFPADASILVGEAATFYTVI